MTFKPILWTGRFKKVDHRLRGTANHAAKLTEDEVLCIRDLYRRGRSMAQLSRDFHCGYQTVISICKRRTWRHI